MEDNEYYFCIKGLNYTGGVSGQDRGFENISIFNRGSVYHCKYGCLYSKFNNLAISNSDTEGYPEIVTPFEFTEHFRKATDAEILTQNHIDALNNFRR